jgi:hypothetical protein
MQVKMVNDTDRLIYAFEMLSTPIVETLVEDVVNQSKMPETNAAVALANNAASLSYTNGSSSQGNLDVLDDIVMILSSSDASGVEVPVDNVLNNSIEPSTMLAAGSESVVTHLESNPDVDWQHNVLNDASVVNAVTGEQPSTSSTLWQDESGNCVGVKTTGDGDYLHLNGASGSWTHEVDGGFSFSGENLDCLDFQGGCPNGEVKTVTDDCTASASALGVEKEDELACVCVADQWKSCVICLEEMADSDLKAHASCGGTLCHNCLEVCVALYINFLLISSYLLTFRQTVQIISINYLTFYVVANSCFWRLWLN